MPFYTDPVTTLEHKFAWYVYLAILTSWLTAIVTTVSVGIDQQTVRTMTVPCSTFGRKVDRFPNVICVAHSAKTVLCTLVAIVLLGCRIA
jgi:hypothetical protein